MKPLWLLGRILGTRCLSFGPRVAWLGEELVASLSEQRGLDAGKKQIVARMGFLEVPLRAGRGPGRPISEGESCASTRLAFLFLSETL